MTSFLARERDMNTLCALDVRPHATAVITSPPAKRFGEKWMRNHTKKSGAVGGAHVSSATSPSISSNSTDLFAGSRAYVHPRSFAIRRNTLSPLESTCDQSVQRAQSKPRRERAIKHKNYRQTQRTSRAAFACLPACLPRASYLYILCVQPKNVPPNKSLVS